jgi:DNA repair ATPase RecN
LIVLLIGFIYTNGTLQRAQTETLESSILTLQNQVDRSLMAVQAALYGEIQRVESKLNEATRPDLVSNLDKVKQALHNLDSRDGNLSLLIEKFDEDSENLQKAFREYQQGKSQPVSGDN